MRKVLYFFGTTDSGSAKAAIYYLYKYPEPFYNVFVCPVAHPLVMYKFFRYVNEVEYHNKSSQSDLALEFFLVTQCGCLRLCTTVDI